MTYEKAIEWRQKIEFASSSMTDKDASITPELFPSLKEDGSLIKNGTRINWENKIKRATVDLWDTAENNPENAPTLWEDIEYKEGYRIIPGTITVGTAFTQGEIGWWKDKKYKSLIANNVWNPDQYAAGWELYE